MPLFVITNHSSSLPSMVQISKFMFCCFPYSTTRCQYTSTMRVLGFFLCALMSQNDQRASWPTYLLHKDDFIAMRSLATRCFVVWWGGLSESRKWITCSEPPTCCSWNRTDSSGSSQLNADLNDRLCSSLALIDTCGRDLASFPDEQLFFTSHLIIIRFLFECFL